MTETYSDPLQKDSHYEPAYTEGRDAGALLMSSAAIAFDGTLYAQAFPGSAQIANGKTGNGTSALGSYDQRALQGANGQLPAGGLVLFSGLGDIVVGPDTTPLPDSLSYGQPVVIGTDGSTSPSPRDPNSILPAARLDTIQVSDSLTSVAGLSELALASSGSITVDADANVVLNAGGVFTAQAGRAIVIDGSVTAPSGKMTFQTYGVGGGSIFAPTPMALGTSDIVVNGTLSVAGRWVNDYQTSADSLGGSAWLDGGSISMYVASSVLLPADTGGTAPAFGQVPPPTDISGSILINASSTLNLNSGGRIDQKGKYQLTAKGGNLTLRSDTLYFQASDGNPDTPNLTGWRVTNTLPFGGKGIKDNPGQINARIAIDPASIEAHGFGGGGTFTLETPQFQLGDGIASTGTELPLNFFSSAGFSTYNITSYKTDLFASTFLPGPAGALINGYPGYNAVLATQTLTIGAGQTLSLIQSVLPSILTPSQSDALLDLQSGGDLMSVLAPVVPTDAWDQKAVNLSLGGLLELHVGQGGSIVGAPGASLTVSKLYNEGTIRIAGGTILQQETLPGFYGSLLNFSIPAIGIRSLSDIFTVNPDGTIDPSVSSKIGNITNGGIAGGVTIGGPAEPIYFLGLLDADQGVVLAPGSVTDLSGSVVLNPRAVDARGNAISTGKVVPGGTLATAGTIRNTGSTGLFGSIGVPVDNGWILPETLVAQAGAVIDLSGAVGTFDERVMTGGSALGGGGYVPTAVWSDAGALVAANGGTFTGADIEAHGGAPLANGGVLRIANPVFAQSDPATPTANVVSAVMIGNAGFDTIDALGTISSSGDVTIKLRNEFVLEGLPYDSGTASLLGTNGLPTVTSGNDFFVPVVKSGGGTMEIDASYISLGSNFDVLAQPNIGTAGTGSVIFKANAIDVTGSMIFDKSVANATLDATGDIRLIGVQPWQVTYSVPSYTPTSVVTLGGTLAANGNLSLIAAQVYPTTGSTYTISSTAANGTISFGRSGADVPDVPYSAGGNLDVFATNIYQAGVIRVPFGTLTLGSNTPATPLTSNLYAPATQNVTLADGSITSVSADGLIIPYGTTTDQKEWYFSAAGNGALTGPPTKAMSLNGGNIAINAGATVDLTGGGDVYAYEFVAGTGGSHDVLSRLNGDQYSSNKGYQYADGRQVYAIVPSLANVPVALYDPIYSSGYNNLYYGTTAGQRVWLDAAPGLAAGWYTLLPAQYALLPGGMRVVEQTGAANVMSGTSVQNRDGSLLVSGHYGSAIAGTAQAQERLFSVESQAVFEQYSKIVTTTGYSQAVKTAAENNTVLPPVGIDAARMVINPLSNLQIDAALSTAAAPGGRGSEVDIGGKNFDIVSTLDQAPADGAIHLTTDSLNNLNAGSLLIGGVRTDNADGTTNLAITAQTITVSNDAAHPLIAPEIVLVVDDLPNNPVASQLTLNDGATLIATGMLNDQRSGAYIIDAQQVFTQDGISPGNQRVSYGVNSGQGALFRVANGPQRLVERIDDPNTVAQFAALGGTLTVGNINASGSSIGFDTSANITVAPDANLTAQSIALGANAMAFTSSPVAAGTVVVTPDLLAALSKANSLTLNSQTSIGFDNGTYSFGSTSLEAQSLLALQGGTVAINADQLQLGNIGAAGAAAGGTGTLNITANTITFGSGTIATNGFGAGVSLTSPGGIFAGGTGGGLDVGNANLTLTTPFIGDHVITGLATETGYDVTLKSGGAVLITNAQTTPVDPTKLAGVPGASVTIEGSGITVSGTMIRATAGAVVMKSGGAITLADGAAIEAPGFNKTYGDSTDPQTRSAPGGSVSLAAAGSGGIALGNATLSVGGGTGNAGSLALSTPNGSVDFGTATLDGVGGAGGTGGTFSIDTLGAVDLVVLNTRVGADGFTGGFDVRTRTGDLTLNAGQALKSGSVSLTADGGVVTVGGTIDTSGVNGGDIGLYGTQGVTLQGTAQLIARANGYGYNGDGTPTYDSRQAKSGNVTLGTDFVSGTSVTNADGSVSGTSGAIRVDAGAIVDVSALHPKDRLVPIVELGTTYYQVVPGDQGGTVTLRAPVVMDSSGHETANVTVVDASSVVGASTINLEAFKRWDLAAVANSGLFTGVTYDAPSNTVTLDTRTGLDTANADGTLTTVAGLNFLGDKGPGTVVDFVQNFDISAAYGNLGGLASESNFHAQPGLDLAATGNIVLASNWNLGAGVVNLTGAVAAGDVTINAGLQVSGDPLSGYVVTAGKEADLFQNFTTMTYRTGGGSVGGEAPAVSLRAGGNLDIKGSISDGLFLFRDQTNPQFLNHFGGTFYANYSDVSNGGFSSGNGATNLTQWSVWPGGAITTQALVYLGLSLSANGQTSIGSPSGAAPLTSTSVPYSAIGNSPAALGAYPQGTGAGTSSTANGGDPLGSAVVFPLLADGSAEASSTYRLVAGAANLGGAASVAQAQNSADAAAIDRTTAGTLTVEGLSTYTYYSVRDGLSSGTPGSFFVDTNLSFQSNGSGQPTTTGTLDSLPDWLGLVSGLAGVSDTGVAVLYIGLTGGTQDINRSLVMGLFDDFKTAKSLVQNSSDPNVGYRFSAAAATDASTQYIAMSVANFKTFVLDYLVPNQAALVAAHGAPGSNAQSAQTQTSVVQTLIRTGTGGITLAASGTVDLRGSDAVTYVNMQTGAIQTSPTQQFNNISGAISGTTQLGGPAIYTVGKLATPSPEIITDPTLGVTVSVDPTPSLQVEAPAYSVFATPVGNAGPIGTTLGLYNALGVLQADPVLLDGGGDVTVNAGQDVLGRVNLYFNGLVPGTVATRSTTNHNWDVVTGAGINPTLGVTIAKTGIDPQLFREGLGALGGGNVTVNAGGNVSDITTASDASVFYGTATDQSSTTGMAMRVGGGNVIINAARDILGGRVDVASGFGTLNAGGDIGDGPSLNYGTTTVEYRGENYCICGVVITLPLTRRDPLAIQINDAVVDLNTRGSTTFQDVTSLGGGGPLSQSVTNGNSTLLGVASTIWQSTGIAGYSAYSGLNVLANGDITITNQDILDVGVSGNGDYSGTQITAMNSSPSYPGSLVVTSMAGSINLPQMLMAASPVGQLELFAALNFAPTAIAMLDNDPGLPETSYPSVLSNTSDTTIANLHNRIPTHTGDATPVYIYAGNDINDVTLNLPKQARVTAGRDIVNMMFFGQNLAPSDITRVVAGRDITASSILKAPQTWGTTPNGGTGPINVGPPEPVLQGNTFVIGGPGEFYLEAGRNMGPFLNSAVATTVSVGPLSGQFASQSNTFTGGVISVGDAWNPYLSTPQGADVNVMFGIGKGADFEALRNTYVAPGAPGNVSGDYLSKLIAWMQQNDPDDLKKDYGTTNITGDQAYADFIKLPELRQRAFLLQVYFDELEKPSVSSSPDYKKYSYGYKAVNTLFPASLGYTVNGLEGGAKSDAIVSTGDLDLRLATIETQRGGNIDILGPGGRVLAGSVVATSVQAARRAYDGLSLFTAFNNFNLPFSAYTPLIAPIKSIPAGGEGVLTLRGGDINTFTDMDFQVNQSRLFTEQGGNILMWSSNGDLNAGQGPKTSANFPPIVVHVDDDAITTVDALGGVTGAGIASLQSTPDSPPGDVYLSAPRGTVDAGDAGVRVSGNLSVTARFVLNADNFKVSGIAVGLPTIATPDVGGLTSASNTAAAATKSIDMGPKNSDQPSVIIVEFLGFGGGAQGDDSLGNQ